MKLRWSHAVFYVRDLEAMLAFYREMLGFEVSDRGPLDARNPALEVAFVSQVDTDHHQLAFVPVRGADGASPLDHMAFRVGSLDDVRSLAQKLRDDGRASDIHFLNHGNAWSVYFKDPEGNGLEVFCDSPFAVQQPQIKQWDGVMSEDELRRQTVEQFSSEPGFEPIADFYAARRERFGD